MKILFLSDNFPPESNAPATRLHEHARVWVHAGHEVTVITCAPNFPEGKLFPGYRNRWRAVESIDGIRVVRVKSYITANEGFFRRTLDYLSFMVTSFAAGLFEKRPDLVVATSPQIFCAAGGAALAAVRRLPFVMEVRDLWPASIAAVGAMKEGFVLKTLERLELYLYRRAAAIVVVTRAFKDDLVRRGVPASRIHVVINGVDLSRYGPRPRDAEFETEFQLKGKFVAGYLGTHGMAHALPSVLAAAALLKDDPRIAFVFAGAGADRARVEQIVTEKGLHNVRLIPRQPKEHMPRLWSLVDLTIVPLRNTPVFATVIPSKIFESMAMGIPLLMAIPEGEAVDLVRATGSGIIVPPEKPEETARSVRMLVDSSTDVARMRSQALAASLNFDRKILAGEMVRVLLLACGGMVQGNR